MSKKCPQCESKDIHITEYPNPNDSMATCYGCGYTGLVEQFPEQSLFDRITASPEVLAETLVFTSYFEDCHYRVRAWKSVFFLPNRYRTKEEAIAATVARLKKVDNGN